MSLYDTSSYCLGSLASKSELLNSMMAVYSFKVSIRSLITGIVHFTSFQVLICMLVQCLFYSPRFLNIHTPRENSISFNGFARLNFDYIEIDQPTHPTDSFSRLVYLPIFQKSTIFCKWNLSLFLAVLLNGVSCLPSQPVPYNWCLWKL